MSAALEVRDLGDGASRGVGPFETAAMSAGLRATGWFEQAVEITTDTTSSALRIFSQRRRGEIVPYGYIASSTFQPLSGTPDVVRAVAAHAGLHRLSLRWLDVAGAIDGSSIATSIVFTDADPTKRFESKARQSIRRAVRAGCEVSVVVDPSPFLGLYDEAASRFDSRYSADLIRSVAANGGAQFFNVVLDGETVSSALCLTGDGEWMYWLSAQNDRGRAVESSYLGVSELLGAAWSGGIPYVNLGANETGGRALPGVERFKRRLGAVDRPLRTMAWSSPVERAVATAKDVVRPLRRRRRVSP
jgi:hypothetical protein